jgi:hypothetical protein
MAERRLDEPAKGKRWDAEPMRRGRSRFSDSFIRETAGD